MRPSVAAKTVSRARKTHPTHHASMSTATTCSNARRSGHATDAITSVSAITDAMNRSGDCSDPPNERRKLLAMVMSAIQPAVTSTITMPRVQRRPVMPEDAHGPSAALPCHPECQRLTDTRSHGPSRQCDHESAVCPDGALERVAQRRDVRHEIRQRLTPFLRPDLRVDLVGAHGGRVEPARECVVADRTDRGSDHPHLRAREHSGGAVPHVLVADIPPTFEQEVERR